ncbi:hypothetical protein CEK62_04170 [Alcanivorax sp. N3-2A]|nr:hypothetical protein CEK62_04170 [Alcanivorax sp. N3-2A]
MLDRIWHRTKEAYSAHYELRAKKYCKHLSENKPIIVLGVQKSGTTAISALLAEAAGKSVALDIQRAVRRPEWKVMMRFGVGSFEEYVYKYRSDFAKEIIKEPGLTFFYEDLAKIFPKASYLMIVRHPVENIRSILNRLKLPGHLPKLDMDQYPSLKESVAWRMNLDTSWMGYHAENYVDALSIRWRLGAETYLRNRNNFTLVKYEDFLKEKKKYIENLCHKFQLPVLHDVTENVERQYQSKGDKSASLRNFFGENYKIIEKTCWDEAGALGYRFDEF